MDKQEIIDLAIAMTQKSTGEFDDSSANSAVLRKELIALNGGSTHIDMNSMYRGSAIFEITRTVLPVMIHEGYQGDEFLFDLIEYRNIALGDSEEFIAKDQTELIVSEAGLYGTTGIRRHRLGQSKKFKVDTSYHYVNVYDEWARFLANRVDWDELVQAVAKAVVKQMRNEVAVAWANISSTTYGLNANYILTGSASENDILDLVEHVTAANGDSRVIILGTKQALRQLPNTVMSDEAKSNLYNMGYFGKFNGTDCVYTPQRHKAGTDEFLLDNNKIYVIAINGDKPIKLVNKGIGILVESQEGLPGNQDFTKELLYGHAYGVAVAFSAKMGFCTFTATI